MRTHFRAFEDFKSLFPSKREKVLKMRNYDITHFATKVRVFIYHSLIDCEPISMAISYTKLFRN